MHTHMTLIFHTLISLLNSNQTTYYSFTPNVTAKYAFSTCGLTLLDTRILVTTVCGTPATTLTCNDDGTGCPNFNSLTPSVDMTAGTTYFIAMGSYETAGTGTGTLRVIQTLSIPTTSPTLSPTWAPQTVGPTAAALTGFNLIETQPDCYFKIGYPYCPAPGAGQQFSDLYASYQDRLGTTLLNAAR